MRRSLHSKGPPQYIGKIFRHLHSIQSCKGTVPVGGMHFYLLHNTSLLHFFDSIPSLYSRLNCNLQTQENRSYPEPSTPCYIRELWKIKRRKFDCVYLLHFMLFCIEEYLFCPSRRWTLNNNRTGSPESLRISWVETIFIQHCYYSVHFFLNYHTGTLNPLALLS